MTDEYIAKYHKAVKSAKSKKELDSILNRLYEDGFVDGTNEGNN